MKNSYLLYFVALFLIISCKDNDAKEKSLKSQAVEFAFRNVAVGLDTPWEIIWGPDNWIWITERAGRISRINPETGEIKPLITISDVFEGGERGLMGMALHPQFSSNPYVYVIYNYSSGSETPIKIVRYAYDGNSLNSPFKIFDGIGGASNHDGARLWIDENLILWVTTGDRTQGSLAQDVNSLNGKVLRMKLDGSPADDNIASGSYVWSYGHRNAQGLIIVNDKVYISEHGPDTDDELNLIVKGGNYGWPAVKGFCDTPLEEAFCEANNVIEPLISITIQSTYAVAGIDYYNNDLIPEWKNSILITSLKQGTLIQAKLNSDGTKVENQIDLFAGQWGRLRDICVSPDGRVFISTSNRDGRGNPAAQDDRIIEIKPEGTGYNDGRDSFDDSIYPNPAFEKVVFLLPLNLSEVRIYNVYGKLINSIKGPQSSNIIEWSLTDFAGFKAPAGLYSLVYSVNGMHESKKFIIAR